MGLDKYNEAQKMRNIMADNLNRHIDRSGKNQTDIARELNIPEMTMSNWVKAKTYPRPDKIQIMADYFGIRRSDLTDEPANNPELTQITEPSGLHYVSNETVQIPILGEISFGDQILAEQNVSDYRTTLRANLPKVDLAYLVVKKDSMKPTVPNGSLVLIRVQEDVENGEIAAVLLNGDTEVTLKRVKKQNDVVILLPDNNEYEPILIDAENPAKIVGRVMKVETDL